MSHVPPRIPPLQTDSGTHDFVYPKLAATQYRLSETTEPVMRWSSWKLELWALGGCFATLAGLIALLSSFDSRTVFQWYNITLNTIVSTMAVTMKAFLIFAVTECIGQWKWIIFSQNKRALLDFEKIDLASRGPLGSMYLLWRKNLPYESCLPFLPRTPKSRV